MSKNDAVTYEIRCYVQAESAEDAREIATRIQSSNPGIEHVEISLPITF